MTKMTFTAFFAAALICSGCARENSGPLSSGSVSHPPASVSGQSSGTGEPSNGSVSESGETTASEGEAPVVSPKPMHGPATNPYINQVILEIAEKITTPEMNEYEKAKTAFDYMIENTVLDEPMGLDLWRVHSDNDARPPFVENRSLSALRFGVGMCEDYAAAFTMLLRGVGLEAEYIPGLTYSAQGNLVDHAWVVAKIDGVWYHLDCQLEDNISRHGAIRYRYFMKSDETMSASHRWGQNLIASGLLTSAQNAEIAQRFLCEPCPRDYPAPARRAFAEAPPPDAEAIRSQIEQEFAAYESAYGTLAPMELNIIPPVFGLEGFGPPDEG